MRKFYFLLIFLFTISLSAQESSYKVKLRNKADLKYVAEYCSIECTYPDGAYLIYTQNDDFLKIEKYFESYKEHFNIIPEGLKTANTIQELSLSWDSYPSFTTYLDFLNDLKIKFPTLIELDTVGYSTKNKPLIFIHFIGQAKPKPEFMYSSSIHGNELTGYVLLMRLANYFASNYNTNSLEGSRVSNLIDNLDIWLMPLNNPDGTYPITDTTVIYSKRTNANGKDLNRNFPDQYTDNYNTTSGRESETAAIMEFVQKHNFNLSANFHTGTVVCNYPWDGQEDGSTTDTTHNCPDSTWFVELSKAYANANPDFKNSSDFENGITNGTAWYPVYGGRQDWMYAFQKGREITIELTDNGIISPTELLNQWDKNKESLLLYAEMGLKGIHGVVIDENNQPIDALIRLKEIPETDVITNLNTGFFARYLSRGIYNIDIIAEGYQTCTINNINLQDTNYIFLNIKFTNRKAGVNDDVDKIFTLNSNKLLINTENISIDNSKLTIYDIKGNIVDSEKNICQSEFDLNHLCSGVYFILLESNGKTYFKKVIL